MFNNIYLDILDNIPDAVYCTNTERKITYWNRSAEILTGISSKEAVGKSCEALLSYEDDSGIKLQPYEYPLNLCLQSMKTVVKDLFLKDKNNERKRIEEKSSPVFRKGKTAGAVSVMRNNDRVFAEVETNMRRERKTG